VQARNNHGAAEACGGYYLTYAEAEVDFSVLRPKGMAMLEISEIGIQRPILPEPTSAGGGGPTTRIFAFDPGTRAEQAAAGKRRRSNLDMSGTANRRRCNPVRELSKQKKPQEALDQLG